MPIITPPPPPDPTPPPVTSRQASAEPVEVYSKEVIAGSEGDFPGGIYRVHYNLAVLKWDESGQKWSPLPADQVELSSNLKNPIVVTWRESSQSLKVKHGVKGKLRFKNLSKAKIRLEFYWVPGGDAWTPPEKESDSMEFVIP